MDPKFFKSQDDFRKWLEKNHKKETELVVGFYKVNSGRPSMTWSESVDQALCFGWIDGVRKSIDENSYQIRFTPRKPSSIWSNVNIKKIETLSATGLMHPAGMAAFEKRKHEKSGIYAFENAPKNFIPSYEKEFKANKRAWDYFCRLAPSYQKTTISFVMSAKQETTRHKRLIKIIKDCEAGTNQWKDNKYIKKK